MFKNVTIIEVMVAVSIVAIICAILLENPGTIGTNSSVSYGVNGMVEQRCINGKVFVVTQYTITQVFAENNLPQTCIQ